MAETLNSAAKEGLPLLFLVIDNGARPLTLTLALTLTRTSSAGAPLGIAVIRGAPRIAGNPLLPPAAGRAINTFTPDVAQNNDVYLQGQHYGVPGIKERSPAPQKPTSPAATSRGKGLAFALRTDVLQYVLQYSMIGLCVADLRILQRGNRRGRGSARRLWLPMCAFIC